MANNPYYSLVTEEIEKLTQLSISTSKFASGNYNKFDIKRGLRDINGIGVLAGLTKISEIYATKTVNDEILPDEGEPYYRGYNIKDIVRGVKTIPAMRNYGKRI